jgi:hypothetical protein
MQINVLTSGRTVTESQFAKWLDEERMYLNSKVTESIEIQNKIIYVEFLIKYQSVQ